MLNWCLVGVGTRPTCLDQYFDHTGFLLRVSMKLLSKPWPHSGRDIFIHGRGHPTMIRYFEFNQNPRMVPTVAYAQCLSFGLYRLAKITKSDAAPAAVEMMGCTISWMSL